MDLQTNCTDFSGEDTKLEGEGHITVFPEILSDNRHRNKAKAR